MNRCLTVLDFSTGEVHIYQYEDFESIENFIEEQGHRIEDCHYMATDRLILQIHE